MTFLPLMWIWPALGSSRPAQHWELALRNREVQILEDPDGGELQIEVPDFDGVHGISP